MRGPFSYKEWSAYTVRGKAHNPRSDLLDRCFRKKQGHGHGASLWPGLIRVVLLEGGPNPAFDGHGHSARLGKVSDDHQSLLLLRSNGEVRPIHERGRDGRGRPAPTCRKTRARRARTGPSHTPTLSSRAGRTAPMIPRTGPAPYPGHGLAGLVYLALLAANKHKRYGRYWT